MALTPKRLFLYLCISISLLRPYTLFSRSPLVNKTLSGHTSSAVRPLSGDCRRSRFAHRNSQVFAHRYAITSGKQSGDDGKTVEQISTAVVQSFVEHDQPPQAFLADTYEIAKQPASTSSCVSISACATRCTVATFGLHTSPVAIYFL